MVKYVKIEKDPATISVGIFFFEIFWISGGLFCRDSCHDFLKDCGKSI